jgi:hypothetical protein
MATGTWPPRRGGGGCAAPPFPSRACPQGARQATGRPAPNLPSPSAPRAVHGLHAAYRTERLKLAATARALGLVERALHGEVFAPSL